MKIGIIGAMGIEVIRLRDQLANRKKQERNGFVFYTGTLDGVEIVLLKSGIGKVNAAIGATLLIEVFRPDYVINTGAAGGFPSDLRIGDVVISEKVAHHDMDCTVFGYLPGQVPGMPLYFEANKELVALAEQSIHELGNLKLKKGLVVTGDQFMNNPEDTQQIRHKFPEADAVEMEGAAIAQTCIQFGVPFVVIRSISDVAGQGDAVEFEEFVETAAVNSANMVAKIIKGLVSGRK